MTFDVVTRSWEPTGAVTPEALLESRQELHWAVQIASTVGKSALTAREDFSHHSFSWHEGPRALAQGIVNGPRPFRSAVRLADLTLLLLDREDQILETLPLAGRTLGDGLSWLEDAVARLSGRELKDPASRLDDIPAHPIREGHPFEASHPEDLQEIDRWYRNAAHMLLHFARRIDDAGPVRCWPHHFDIASLILVDEGEDAEKSKTIGVGALAGDSLFDEPYYYVAPWPRLSPQGLPELDAGGRWNTENWVGAVLAASDLASTSAPGQAEQIAEFLDSAITTCRDMLF